MNADDPGTAPPSDVLFVYGQTAGDAYSVVRRRGDTVELGALQKLEEGKPIHGEIVKLNRRAEHPLFFDVDVLADTSPAARSGPAQVATQAYRENWDVVFGTPKGDLN